MGRRSLDPNEITALRKALGLEPSHGSHLWARLQELRQEHGLSLAEVAEMTGRGGKGVISLWEKPPLDGGTVPEPETLLLLADLYGVSMDYLYGRPGADRDSTMVQSAKAFLRCQLNMVDVSHIGPAARLKFAYRYVQRIAPGAFPKLRLALRLGMNTQELDHSLSEESPVALDKSFYVTFSELIGVPLKWFLGQEK